MNNSLRVILTGSIGAAALALALATGALSTNAATTQPVETVASPTQETGGVSEGIQVHGHWVIEVLDPDGTVATRREFENGLVPDGQTLLANILARTLSPGLWQIGLGDGTGVGPCLVSGAPAGCGIVESADPSASAENSFPTLSITVPGNNQVMFSGSATAQRDGTVAGVLTMLDTCPGTQASQVCATGSVNTPPYGFFTQATLPSPVSVVTGQQIQVTVTISFG